eukprot:2136911-Lingulodinium_polyedra.AAC.1
MGGGAGALHHALRQVPGADQRRLLAVAQHRRPTPAPEELGDEDLHPRRGEVPNPRAAACMA